MAEKKAVHKAHKEMHVHHKEMVKHHEKELKHHESMARKHMDAEQDKKMIKAEVKKSALKK